MPTKHAPRAAGSLIAEAELIVNGDRQATHGEKERSFALIADLWTLYLNGRKDFSHCEGYIRPEDVAAMMVLLKIARAIQGSTHPDHFIDMVGYAGIAGELALARLARFPSPGEAARD